jgi:hypothetical protein
VRRHDAQLGNTLISVPVAVDAKTPDAMVNGLDAQPALQRWCRELLARHRNPPLASPVPLKMGRNLQTNNVDDPLAGSAQGISTVLALGRLVNKGRDKCDAEGWALQYAVAHLNALQLMPAVQICCFITQMCAHRMYNQMSRPAPLGMTLLGLPGMGKSEVIKTVLNYAQAISECDCIWVSAPTGLAASNIGGITLHRQFGWGKAGVKPASEALLCNFDDMYLGIVDEISMISPSMLEMIDKSLKAAARSTKESFGGQGMILAGDFYQLVPVQAAALYKGMHNMRRDQQRGKKQGLSNMATGSALFATQLEHSSILRTSMCAKDDPALWRIKNLCYGYERHGREKELAQKLADQEQLHTRFALNPDAGVRINLSTGAFHRAKAGFVNNAAKCSGTAAQLMCTLQSWASSRFSAGGALTVPTARRAPRPAPTVPRRGQTLQSAGTITQPTWQTFHTTPPSVRYLAR